MSGFGTTILQMFQDRNGEGSGKRRGQFISELLIATSVICFFALGKTLPEPMWWGLITLAGGTSALTLMERQKKSTEQIMAEKPTNNEVIISANETGTSI